MPHHHRHEHVLPLPINDLGDILAHMKRTWGDFSVDENGQVGGVNHSEIAAIILDWVSACDVALIGYDIIERALRQNNLHSDYRSIKCFNDFAAALGSPDRAEAKLLIERAKRAFLALQKPDEKLFPEDIDAAQRLVAGFDRLYRPRKIDVR